jgi:hypothetical protein
MEEQLRRAVVVTISGTRPEVDLVDAEALLHSAFRLGPSDMSIRAYSPEDFLVLCADVRVRDSMVAQGLVHAPRFSLVLRGWLRQAHATAMNLPFLVPVELTGVPGDAWNKRTAEVLLDGSVSWWMSAPRRRDGTTCRFSRFGCARSTRKVCRRQGCCLWRSRRCWCGPVGVIAVLP